MTTSNINASAIDTTFPIAGQDNSSQGFRDNYVAIKTALTTATSEITDLYLRTPKLNEDSNFSWVGTLSKARFKNVGYTVYVPGTNVSTIDVRNGAFQKSAITTSTTFQITEWPTQSDIYAEIKLEVTPSTSNATNINFSVPGTATLYKEGTLTLPYTSVSTGPTVWQVWSPDGGTSVYLKFVGGPFV